jgi:hypothetical protein
MTPMLRASGSLSQALATARRWAPSLLDQLAAIDEDQAAKTRAGR